MKGLFVKDFKLMNNQKRFFFVIVFIAAAMMVTMDDASFIIGYLTFIGSLFAISTISYDEFDNGNAFLFTLPISRKKYVWEKYLFGIVTGGVVWIFSSIVVFTYQIVTGNNLDIMEWCCSAVIILLLSCMILAIMIPIQLKFGSEKGRIAIIGIFGSVFVIGFLLVKAAKALRIDYMKLINMAATQSLGLIMGISAVVCFAALAISIVMSVNIMEKKEL